MTSTFKIFFSSIIAIFTLIIIFSCDTDKAGIKSEQKPLNKAEKIDSLIGLYSDYGGFNGAALVSYEGEVIYKKGFGLANMEWDVANQSDTKFQIASISKQFTAMLIMQLVAVNKLELDQPISNYLPEYPKNTADKVTIHQLLTHSSGIPNANTKEKAFRPKDMVNQFAEEPLLFAPGERFDYSNSGYTLLGYLIETITEKPYEEVLQEKIFKPLQMDNSGLYKHKPIVKNMSSGYNKWYGNFYDTDHTDESSAYAAGGIYSTVEDLFLWDQALYTDILLPKKYMDMIFTKHIADPEYGGYYGYGWELVKKEIGNTDETVETISHGGSINGYRSSFKRVPSTNSSIILLNNTNRAFLNSITKAVLGILYDQPYDFPRKPTAQFMVEVIEKEGIEKGIQFYKEHKDLDTYYSSEQELIIEGYRLLHSGNAKDAAEVFKLSTEAFPDRDNPYDSYGESLLVLGDTIKAIENYKKSVALNPNNQNGIAVLRKLGVEAN